MNFSSSLENPVFLLFFALAFYSFFRNFLICLGFFIYFGLIKKNSQLIEIWELFKLVPSLKEKITIVTFFLSFGISNKVMINNSLSMLSAFIILLSLQLAAFVFPILYFVLVDYALMLAQSFFYGFSYAKSSSFNNFVNTRIFQTDPLRTKFIFYILGNPFSKSMKGIGLFVSTGGLSIGAENLIRYKHKEELEGVARRAHERARLAIELSKVGPNPSNTTAIEADRMLEEFKKQERKNFEEAPLLGVLDHLKDFSKRFF